MEKSLSESFLKYLISPVFEFLAGKFKKKKNVVEGIPWQSSGWD